jgi:hypothetical protein
VALEVLALLAMSPFLLIEACTIQAYGWGWLNAWNMLDALTYVFQVGGAAACARPRLTGRNGTALTGACTWRGWACCMWLAQPALCGWRATHLPTSGPPPP